MLTLLHILSISTALYFKPGIIIYGQNENSSSEFLDNILNLSTVFEVAISQVIAIIDPHLTNRDLKFYLYTNEEPKTPYELKTFNADNLRRSNFVASRATKVIIHGWFNNGKENWIRTLVDNYLKVGNFNIIVVSWAKGAFREYFTSTAVTSEVGAYVSQLLRFLRSEAGLSYEQVHIIGHSLGCHVAGFVGSYLGGNIGRITALDPVGIGYETLVPKDASERLDPTDAIFVDVIHTSAIFVGFVAPLGHIDFYPNGGSTFQPGCDGLISTPCSHGRSHRYMAESILKPRNFPALQCDNYQHFQKNKCGTNPQVAFMGEYVNTRQRGKFYLKTNAESPFGKGTL